MSDLQAIKDRARREARTRRKTAAASIPDAAERAALVFLESVRVKPPQMVSLYRAIQSELDPAPLVAALRARGIPVCFPVVKAAGTPLEFRAADEGTRFIPGAFGAAIPEDGSPVVLPDVIIAPLLTFDRALYRLGYGGGFYDRTLEDLRAQRPTRAYGYAYAAQEVDAVPIEETDQRLDGIITEAGLISDHDE